MMTMRLLTLEVTAKAARRLALTEGLALALGVILAGASWLVWDRTAKSMDPTGSATATERPTDLVAPKPTGTDLGCREYCIQLGPPGHGRPSPAAWAGPQSLRLTEGVLAVDVVCRPASACRGLIVLSASRADEVELGRSDFTVQGNSTGTVRVRPSAEGLKVVRNGEPLFVTVTVTISPESCPADYSCVAESYLEVVSSRPSRSHPA
jgi:hypothetical protein